MAQLNAHSSTRTPEITRRNTHPGLTLVLAVMVMGCWSLAQEEIRVVAAIEGQEFFEGEPFLFQVQITGSNDVEPPDLSGIGPFSVQDLGGQQNNSQSITIVNGRMTKVVNQAHIYSYRITGQQEGRFVIPSLSVEVGGREYRTQPIPVVINKPEETDDFKLRMALSKSTAYVGEPIRLTVTWYLGQDVKSAQFSVPALDPDHFFVAEREAQVNPDRQYYQLPLGDGEVVAEKGRGQLEGKTFATLSFTKVLIPKHSGTINLAPASVACEAFVGYRKSRSPFNSMHDDFFSDFFSDDFFGRSRRGVYQTVVVPSNGLQLKVRDLPSEGQPPGFAGHVGHYALSASAAPTQVAVGDPITLTLELTGPEYLDHVQLPSLQDQPQLVKDFKIPKDMAAGKVEGNRKVFTQTLRAKHADVSAIPGIALPYFDTRTGKYDVARTEPIPLTVKATRVVTARDAEGVTPVEDGLRIEAWKRGIAHNYDDLSTLQNHRYAPDSWLSHPQRLLAVCAPPLVYALLYLGLWMRRRSQADPEANRSRKALSRFQRQWSRLGPSPGSVALLQIFRDYLGAKLRLPSAALVWADVAQALERRDVPAEIRDRVRAVFDRCEAERYAGGQLDTGAEDLSEALRTTVKQLERELK